jgi:hypothetical protein
LFFDENDYFTIASFAHSDTVDPHTIKNLLLKLFGQNTNKNKNKNLPSASSQYIALPMDQIEVELDMRLTVILTLLIWLEIEGFIKVLSRMTFYFKSLVTVPILIHFHSISFVIDFV